MEDLSWHLHLFSISDNLKPMKEHIVKDGVYIPETGITYPEDPHQYLYKPTYTKERGVIDGSYPFLDNSFSARLLRFFTYTGIFLPVFLIHPLVYGLKIEGRENIRKNRKLLKNGAITVCNHVYRWDMLAVLQAVKYRKLWFPTRGDLIYSTDAKQVLGAGGIPIPDTISGMKSFSEAFDELHRKKQWIHFFPETCRWDFYQPIRPFETGAFTFAWKYNIPVIPMVITFRPRTGIYRLFKSKDTPLTTIHIGEPIMPDTSMTRKKCSSMMRDEAHRVMVEMAGIEQNCWESSI